MTLNQPHSAGAMDRVHELLQNQPAEQITLRDRRVTLLGTAHISRESARLVNELIDTGEFDQVAVELCPSRYQMLSDRIKWQSLDMFQMIRQGKAGLMLANLALSAYQKRLADQFGIEPGAEMRAAMEAAQTRQLPLLLIDRDLGVTMKRVWRRLGIWQRFMLFSGLMASVFTRESITEEEIEKLKEGDMLESVFAEFAQRSPALYHTLIEERDRYMAASLATGRIDAGSLADQPVGNPAPDRPRHTLVVIGAGHLRGVSRNLQKDDDPDAILQEVSELPAPSRWPKLIPWLLAAIVITGFAIGFSRSPELGLRLIATWLLFNGLLAALGAALARGHPWSVLSALLASPLTSLNPTVAAGMVSASVEALLRKPKVADFESLRDDVSDWRGWWHNRVSRILLVFLFTNIGSSAGAWLAGLSILEQLL